MAIFSALPGMNTQLTLAYQWFAMLSGLLIVSAIGAWFLKYRSSPLVHRQLKGYATAQTPYHYGLQIENPKLKAFELQDAPDLVIPTISEWRLAMLKPEFNFFDRFMGFRCFQSWIKMRNPENKLFQQGEFRQGKWYTNLYITFPHRGCFKWTHSQIYRIEPLGFMRSVQYSEAHSDILVLPQRFNIPPFKLPSRGDRLHQPKSLSSQVGQQGDFSSLREYHQGDSLKHIHWRSSAKVGELRVMEYQEERSQRTAVILEPHAKNETCFELAVSVAASFCHQLPSDQLRVDLLFIDQQCHRISCGRQEGPSLTALKALANVQAQVDSQHVKLKQVLFQNLDLMSSAILVTCVWEEEQWSLCSELTSKKLPIIVLYISEHITPPLGPLKAYPQRFIPLHPQSCQEGLARLGRLI